MSFKVFFYYYLTSGGHFGRQCGAILAILIEGHSRNTSVKFSSEIEPLALEEMSFKRFFFSF